MADPSPRRFAAIAAAILLIVGLPTAARAATMAFAGTVVNVQQPDPRDKQALANFTVKVDYLEYMTRGGFNRDSKAGETTSEQIRSVGSVCMLNGRLMDAAPFAEALRPGMWGYVYESSWCDLYTLPNFEWGEVVSVDEQAGTFELKTHRTGGTYHLGPNPPVVSTVSLDGPAIELEGETATAKAAIKPGHWVQVHPPRSMLIDVRTPAADFDPSRLPPVYLGRRGLSNRLCAPARLRGFRMGSPNALNQPSHTLEVTRYRDGAAEPITLRSDASIFMDGKAAPPSIALRVGRPMVLIHYRAESSPHNVFVYSDNALRGRIEQVGDGVFTVQPLDRVSGKAVGEPVTVAIADDARVELDGQPAAVDAIRAGREVAVFASRGRTIRAFAPQTDDRPAFTVGGSVEGRVAGTQHRDYRETRMTRVDLALHYPLRGPTSVTHRRLYVAARFRDGKLESLTPINYARHERGPAWEAELIEPAMTLNDGKLAGRFSLQITPMPKGRESPIAGGRYDFSIDASVVANHVVGTIETTHEGRTDTRGIQGTAVSLPLRPPSDREGVYRIELTDPQRRVRPLTLHLLAEKGQFVRGLATSLGDGFAVDVESLRIEGDRVRGDVALTMPAHRAGLPGDERLAISMSIDIELVADVWVGSFEGTWGEAPSASPASE